MNPICANCFKRDAKKLCGKCGCRYCSPECQKTHWKASHKQWCGKAGQWGRDYEIKPSSNNQGRLGIFALRPFKKYETIVVEREVTVGPGGEFSDLTDDRLPEREAANYDWMMKFGGEEMQRRAKLSWLLLNRINNDCLGNARTLWNEPGDRINVMKAARDIAAGEEICQPINDMLNLGQMRKLRQVLLEKPCPDLPFQDRNVRQAVFKHINGGIECKCAACTNPDVDTKLGQLYEFLLALDKIYPQPGLDVGKIKGNVKEMVALADELGCAPPVYFKIYSTLYDIMVSNAQHFTHRQEMKKILANLKEISTEWYGPESLEAKKIKECANFIAGLVPEFPKA